MPRRGAIVGVGSPHGDDVVGWRVVEGLREMTPGEVETFLISGPDLLTLSAGYEIVWLVDACRAGLPPGIARRFTWPEIPAERTAAASSHGLGLAEALELLTALGKLPARVVLWTIEIGSTAPGTELSPEVARAAARVQRQLLRECDLFAKNGLGT